MGQPGELDGPARYFSGCDSWGRGSRPLEDDNSNALIAQLAAEIDRIAAETARGKCETTRKD